MSQVSGSRMGALWPQIQHHPAWTNQNKGATHVTVAAGVCYLQFVVVVYVFWLVWGVSGGLQPFGPNWSLREGHDRPHPNGPTRHTSWDRKPGGLCEQQLCLLDVWSCEFKMTWGQRSNSCRVGWFMRCICEAPLIGQIELPAECNRNCMFVFRWFGLMEESMCHLQESLTNCAVWVSHCVPLPISHLNIQWLHLFTVLTFVQLFVSQVTPDQWKLLEAMIRKTKGSWKHSDAHHKTTTVIQIALCSDDVIINLTGV